MAGRIARGGWFVLGWIAVGVGSIGVIVPGLPTTVFFIVAAWCFSKSSPRFEQWVLDRPGVGPMVRDYRSGLGMPGTAKTAAISSIAVVCSLGAFVAIEAWWVRGIVLGAGAVGIGWILWRVPTRPTGRPPLALPGRWYRVVAVAEAITWLGLLVGMVVKYWGSGSETGVEVFGLVHGVVVLVYVAVVAWCTISLGWGSRTTILALLASVPPGGTLVFEAWAERTLRLCAPRDRTPATT